MTQYWEPGTSYNNGDVVEYEGHRYKIIQPHRSQSDWAPTVTPALWGRLQDGDHGQQHHGGGGNQQHPWQAASSQQSQQSHPWQVPSSQQSHQQPSQAPPQQQQQQASNNQPPSTQQGQPTDSKTGITQEERKKNWYDLDDDRKKQLEVGGGLLAGAAALGAGYYAYKSHEKNDEEKKAQLWGLQNWLTDAKTRAEDFRSNGPRGPATWVLTEGKNIPQNAIVIGEEHNWRLYASRAFIDNGILLGKASDVFKKGAVIGYRDDEIDYDTYEVLVGDMKGLRWINTSGRLNLSSLGARPVEGGRENDGTPLYVARAPHKGTTHPGKCSEKLDGAYIPYDGGEKRISNYEVLVYA